MNQQKKDIDSLSRELLSKSLLKPESADFNEKLMQKIELSSSPAKWNSNGKNMRKGQFYLLIAVCCFIATIAIIGEFLQGYDTQEDFVSSITINYIFYGGLGLSMLLVLYYFDKLMQALMSNKKWVLN